VKLVHRGLNEAYAILSTFRFISNFHYFKVQVEEKWNMEIGKELEKDVLEMLENPLFQEARHFVQQEVPTSSLFINGDLITDSENIDDYFRRLLGQGEDELRGQVFRLLDLDLTLDFSTDHALHVILQHLEKLDFPGDVKWFLISLIQNPELQLKRFQGTIDRFLPLYEELKEKNMPQYQHFRQWFEAELNEHGVDFLDKHVSFINLQGYEEVQLSYSLFDLLSSHHLRDGGLHLFVGMLFQKYVQERTTKKDMDTHLMTLKVLGDPTRLEILKFLTANESYGQEIAEKFGISTATVSYHMDYFLGASLIHIERKGRRLYYSVNKSQIRDCLKFLANEFEL